MEEQGAARGIPNEGTGRKYKGIGREKSIERREIRGERERRCGVQGNRRDTKRERKAA